MLVDCDGTLAPQDMKVTARVRDAVTELAAQVPVGIVSSRDHFDIRWLAGDMGFTAPQISEGGARVFHVGPGSAEGQPLWVKPLKAEDGRAIVDYLEAAGLSFGAIDGTRRVSGSDEITEWRLTRVSAFSLTPEQATDVAREIGEALDGVHAATIIRTDNGEWMVDFTHAEATKAEGAARFAEFVGVPLGEIAGVGDSFNDLPLLEACGSAVAMGQAPPSLKAAADYIAPSGWEDGLATAIEKFISPRLA
jgi:HAD superfamily hydrolase (TIGR01484 family)